MASGVAGHIWSIEATVKLADSNTERRWTRMPRVTPSQRETIIRRRGNISDGDGQKHPITNLEIHHKDRDPENNDPRNLRVLTPKEHDDLHRRSG